MTTAEHHIQAAGAAFMAPCLGGFCPRRTACSHYVSPTTRTEPSERLCKRGGPDLYAPLGAPAHREGVPA